MGDKAKPPERIFLQIDDDGEPKTFAADQVDDSDIEFIRADLVGDEPAVSEGHKAAARLDALWRALEMDRQQQAKLDEGVGDG